LSDFLRHLGCGVCKKQFDSDRIWNLCPVCHNPLFAIYDLEKIGRLLKRDDLSSRPPTLWRYREFLPVDISNDGSLGEGYTPLIRSINLGSTPGLGSLYIKDEGANPSGSFKMRGMAVALIQARELGIREVVVPSTGYAGIAAAAYANRIGIKIHLYLPVDTPEELIHKSRFLGGEVRLIEGFITDCIRAAADDARLNGWFELSPLRQPYQIEGEKTLGLELAEQMGWDLPDVIIFPTGTGSGLLAIGKAIEELMMIGWVSRKPRLVAAQAAGCAPVVSAFDNGEKEVKAWPRWPETSAVGLAVPRPPGGSQLLNLLRETKGRAIAVTEQEIKEAVNTVARSEGILLSPEGGVAFAALKILTEEGWIRRGERVVIINTASGMLCHRGER